ncbi:MAG TPA: acetyl-CoA C-acyltransferase [Pseudomonas sp.]|jgi:acetyl-CoA C-acetyltransferase|uniref:Acetyl-CoA C-acyltransferase family protein n=1 Tax=Pseudomonas spirodelae TaxID=3101751 RepID=A0ABU5PBI7_9PSED|nr:MULTISPECIES: acetyl-CoA C-acyltransferase family protein [Pseudomonadaceae]EKY0785992.1 acetyl-CoA C-acyltransferase family protein [Pseudomonas aeruginosa]HCA25959.1 acetyl-CoA C-acyltransferase [Pseudomonas sp.]KJS74239.1 MAG: acetyl-CoA acetyltransferase [[Pseudomonas] sp. BICA1-14]MCO3671895.1 acetyl-CoA C-acyltransferase [Pseudomonas aeruginosa]MCS9193035.1 acetyl-CoA C-acyltransferase family protein [Pseudomonas aeruginosa]|tara:strand:+ start:263 stop:1447 length:1185 start_codon:yes stop_codon:yes gene_type:complete
MSTPEVYIVSAVRTAIGSFGGALKEVPLSQLATTAVSAALQRSGCAAERVGHVVMGNVIPTEARDAYLGRVAAMQAGIPKETPAFNVNRLCGSGLQAIVSAAQSLLLGDCDIAIGAGAESMSRGAYLLPGARWGGRMGDMQAVDYMLGILHDPFHRIHMGITAENIAERLGISREAQDALALQSQQRAARAIAEGRFAGQIVPVEVKTRKGVQLFEVDEHVRGETSLEQLAAMKTAFKAGGTVTAGNASGLNDGAAALLMASGAAVKSDNLRPLARLVSYAHAGVDPELMGLGPIPATRLALQRAGLSVADLDVIESNEAFAAQACAVASELDFDPAKVNPNGSGISLGHPVGASGAIIATKAIHELHRIQGRYALATMCIGGGQGIAVVFERV